MQSKYSNINGLPDELYYLSHDNDQDFEVSDDDFTDMKSSVDNAFEEEIDEYESYINDQCDSFG